MIRARLNPAPPPEILEKPVVGVLLPLPLADAYDYASRGMTENMLKTEAEEGICAFLEKREPKWPL